MSENCPKCGAKRAEDLGDDVIRYCCATVMAGDVCLMFGRICLINQRDQLRAEVERLEKKLADAVRFHTDEHKDRVRLEAEVERLETMNKKLAIAAGAQAKKLGAKCERYRVAGELLARMYFATMREGWEDSETVDEALSAVCDYFFNELGGSWPADWDLKRTLEALEDGEG